MKTLYLLRHASPEAPADAPMGDFMRALTPDGVREGEALGDFIKASGALPDFVLGSSSVRTLQTSRVIFGRLFSDEGVKVASHFDRALYLASAPLLMEQVEGVADDVATLLVVAHNPGIADLAQALSGGALADHTTDFPPGTLAVFECGVESWQDITPATARLARVFIPGKGTV